MKLHLTVDRDGEDFEVVADVEYHRAYRGQRDSCGGVRGAGPPLEPDEPAGFEIGSVTDGDGNAIDVDKKLEEQKKEEKPEESRPEEKSETIEDKIPPVGEIKKESNFIEGMPIENPKG